MRLFHFSEEAGIELFAPRPVRVASARPPGREWLNGPLVWAIEEAREPLYLFPRDCPRILLWPLAATKPEDLATWWSARSCRFIAHIEWAWLDRLRSTTLHRYELPAAAFESLDDAGMWVSRKTVEPVSVEVIDDLPAALREHGVELRIMESLSTLKAVWSSTLHASGVRLRNAGRTPEQLDADKLSPCRS